MITCEEANQVRVSTMKIWCNGRNFDKKYGSYSTLFWMERLHPMFENGTQNDVVKIKRGDPVHPATH
jgi:hypothetical protein